MKIETEIEAKWRETNISGHQNEDQYVKKGKLNQNDRSKQCLKETRSLKCRPICEMENDIMYKGKIEASKMSKQT